MTPLHPSDADIISGSSHSVLQLYLDCLFYPRRRSGILCAVDVRQEHGVDQRGLAEAGFADDL